jgi:hypothetical protein
MQIPQISFTRDYAGPSALVIMKKAKQHIVPLLKSAAS